jgi:hypothetical protein
MPTAPSPIQTEDKGTDPNNTAHSPNTANKTSVPLIVIKQNAINIIAPFLENAKLRNVYCATRQRSF